MKQRFSLRPRSCFIWFVQVSEKAIDYKIWKALFDIEIPYKPTYLPNTKLARSLCSVIILTRVLTYLLTTVVFACRRPTQILPVLHIGIVLFI